MNQIKFDLRTYKYVKDASLPYWPDIFLWQKYRLTNKRYARDNRLMFPESSHWRERLAPRCRLIISWWCIRCQGFGCSPIKMVRELGSKRRETVWSLSTVHLELTNRFYLSTRGPGTGSQLWCNYFISMLRSYAQQQ